jgi:hypothetical protein
MAQGSGLLSPNEPMPKSSNPEDGYAQPTEEEKKLAKQIDKLFEKAAKNRKKYDKDWVDNYRMFRGDQWLKRRPAYKHKEVINLIFETIQSQVSVMLDTRPQVGFLPQDPTDLPFTEVLTDLFQADWDRNNWLDEVTQVVMDSHIYSVGMSCCSYDEYLNNGAGGVSYYCEDPFDFYPDPESSNVNKKSEFFIAAKPMDIDVVKKKWANSPYIDQIKPDLEDMSYEKRQLQTLHRRKHTDLDTAADESSYGSSSEEGQNKVLVIHAYLHPSDTEVIEKEDLDADGEKLYITRKRYPQGRMVTKIGQFIMEDGPLPYDDMEFPFQRLINYILPREFYGISEIDNTKGPQMTFNKLVNFALDVMTLMGNPIWKVPTEGNVNTRKLVNQPGLIVEYANGAIGEPKREEGVQLQPFVLDLIDRMEQWFNNIAGTQDVTRGINPPGVTANAAIENLLETASKRIKQKMRNLDSYMRDFGKQWVSRVMQYYTAPQVYRITNKEEVNQYFKFNVEHRETGELDAAGKPKTQKVAVVRKAYKGEDGSMIYEERPSEYEIKGDFDVKINTISGLPFNKAENEQRLLALFDRGIIDSEEVLTKMDYPNKEQILQRMKQAQAEQAQAEQQPPAQGVA